MGLSKLYFVFQKETLLMGVKKCEMMIIVALAFIGTTVRQTN